jgi:phosphoglycolate phosphatase
VTGGAPPIDPLAGIDLVIFDKDGTLIEFRRMWSGWVAGLSSALSVAHGASLAHVLYPLMGVDPATGDIQPHAAIAATPMIQLRSMLVSAIAEAGLGRPDAAHVVEAAWHSPDPVVLARPLADLPALFATLRQRGIRIAVVTSDDREPTERTLDHLGITDQIDAVACADDGRPVKPAPDAAHWACRSLGIPEARTAMVGDAPADLRMGRAAGLGRVIGVLTGVGDEDTLGPLADLLLPSIADLVVAG